jgi:hypothetical protein
LSEERESLFTGKRKKKKAAFREEVSGSALASV